MQSLLPSSCSPSRILTSFSKIRSIAIAFSSANMSVNMQSHAFAGNPLKSWTPKPADPCSPTLAFEALKAGLTDSSSTGFKILPFRKGRPLTSTEIGDDGVNPIWRLGLISLAECKALLANADMEFTENRMVYLGSRSAEDCVLWAIEFPTEGVSISDLGKFSFVELRTLMVATDWSDVKAMNDLSIAGHARALLEWHNVTRFCGHCGSQAHPKDAGRRKICSNEQCNKTVYPRVDPVVIMLVIDRVNDRVLLSRQSRFVPRMWSCLAGFIEPGECLEEAVRRETLEETGIEVGEVIYHSSQPWPVGPNGVPCQLMVGFFAYAKSFDVKVDKTELEDAAWHSREDVTKALKMAEYKKAQRAAAAKVEEMCNGVAEGRNLSADYNVESGELAPMFFPGPFAIAHHLISSWVHGVSTINGGPPFLLNSSFSSL